MEREWKDCLPSWEGMDRRAEVEFDDGRVLVGRLAATDYFIVDEDGSEEPGWSLELDNGESVELHCPRRWRYTGTE